MADTLGPVSFLGMVGGVLGPPLSPSRGRVEAANLLPVFLSLTALGLKPKRPPPPLLGAGWGFGAGFSCGAARGRVVALWTPPIGGGGGGGGGAPAGRQGKLEYPTRLLTATVHSLQTYSPPPPSNLQLLVDSLLLEAIMSTWKNNHKLPGLVYRCIEIW